METVVETRAAAGSARLVRLALRDSCRGRICGGKAPSASFGADYHRLHVPLTVWLVAVQPPASGARGTHGTFLGASD